MLYLYTNANMRVLPSDAITIHCAQPCFIIMQDDFSLVSWPFSSFQHSMRKVKKGDIYRILTSWERSGGGGRDGESLNVY